MGYTEFMSFGGGVNSVAMLLILRDEGWQGEAVFADHHCDWPETYAYLDMLTERGYEITRLDTGDLYEANWRYGCVPTRMQRSCTRNFKTRPLRRYMRDQSGGEWRNAIGFAADEDDRAANMRNYDRTGEEVWFPLIERNIDRAGCIALIEAHGLSVPPKSGCFFCPFQRRDEVKRLRREHPELYCRIRKLEAHCRKPGLYIFRDMPVEQFVEENQPDLFGWRPPCLCEL